MYSIRIGYSILNCVRFSYRRFRVVGEQLASVARRHESCVLRMLGSRSWPARLVPETVGPKGRTQRYSSFPVAVSVWALLWRTFRVRGNLMFVRDSVFPSCTMFEWTEDECLQLIELYKTKALLWDPKHPNYFKKSLKEESWREIACELGSHRSDVDCKNKIVSLLSSHRREKNKTKQSQSSRKGKVCFFTYLTTIFCIASIVMFCII